MRDIKGIHYALKMAKALELQMGWESKSDNPELKELGDILTEITFYINSIELDKISLELERIELTKENAYLLSRAIKAEEELDKIKGSEVDFSLNDKINQKLKIAEGIKKAKDKIVKEIVKPKF